MDDKSKAQILGKRLKKLRESLNLSQKEFAEKVGCSQQYVSHFETGYRIAPIELLMDICEIFNMSLSYFDPDLEVAKQQDLKWKLLLEGIKKTIDDFEKAGAETT